MDHARTREALLILWAIAPAETMGVLDWLDQLAAEENDDARG